MHCTHTSNPHLTPPHLRRPQHYGADITSDSDGNKDVWMTRLTYGCDDTDANNYKVDADVAECCHYTDVSIGGGATSEVSLTLQVDLADALNRTLNTPADDSCAAWRDTVISDLACALRVPANLITSSTAGTCAALSADAGAKTIAVSVTFHPSTSGPTATELKNKLVTALKDARSQVWSGIATRYTLKAIAASDSSMLFTRDSTDDAYEYFRGTSLRVSKGVGIGTRSSSTARIAGDGAYIVYESESDELGLGLADGVYHIYRMEVATGTKVLVTPVDQASTVDSKYASSSADGTKICYYSNAPNTHTNQCDGCDTEYQWWLATANAANTGFGTPKTISWSSADGRKATSNGRCQVSNDGSAIVFSTDSDLSAPSVPAASATPAGDYQVWVTRDDGATATLMSGGINDPSNTAAFNLGSDCYDPTLNSDGSFAAFRCKKKVHPSGYQPGSTADDEGWLYDRAANKLTMFAEMNMDDESACAGSTASKADLLAKLAA